jgi:hypothetical protein
MLFYFIIGVIITIIYSVDKYQKANRYQPWINHQLNPVQKRRKIYVIARSIFLCVLWPLLIIIMIGTEIKNAYIASKSN